MSSIGCSGDHLAPWFLNLPRFHTNQEDYSTAEGLIEELKRVTNFVTWDDKTKSWKLVCSVWGACPDLKR